MISAKLFRSKLYHWAQEHPRDYPWIGEKDPYKIWISEVLLQQTRSDQAKPYYLNFIHVFPSLNVLAKASLDEVLIHWQGLGYYSRARNLHASAKLLAEHFKGKFPQEPLALQKIKGIGPYTSAAIASFAFDFPVPVMDGNVIRVFSRLLGITNLPKTQKDKNEWNRILANYLDAEQSAKYNQSLMNFGAVHCKPVNPECADCPFQTKCVACLTDAVDAFPAKKIKSELKKRYLHFVLLTNKKKQILIQQRNENDIWKSLYQLPLIESREDKRFRTLTPSKIFPLQDVFSANLKLTFLETHVIKLSHQELYCQFYKIAATNIPGKIKPPFSFVNRENLVNFAFPSVIKKFLKSNNLI